MENTAMAGTTNCEWCGADYVGDACRICRKTTTEQKAAMDHYLRRIKHTPNEGPEYYGNLALVAMRFYVQTGNLAEQTAAVVYTRLAARRVLNFVNR